MEPLDGAVLIVTTDHLAVRGLPDESRKEHTHLTAQAIGLRLLGGRGVDGSETDLFLLLLLRALGFRALYNLRLRGFDHLALLSVLINLRRQFGDRVVHKSRDALGQLHLFLGERDRLVGFAFESEEQRVLDEELFDVVRIYTVRKGTSAYCSTSRGHLPFPGVLISVLRFQKEAMCISMVNTE